MRWKIIFNTFVNDFMQTIYFRLTHSGHQGHWYSLQDIDTQSRAVVVSLEDHRFTVLIRPLCYEYKDHPMVLNLSFGKKKHLILGQTLHLLG